MNKNPNFSAASRRNELDYHADNMLLMLNCHHLGTIQTFDPETQTAKATIDYKKVIYQQDPQSGLTIPTLVDYPPLVDCPVHVLMGQNGGVTVPVLAGDKCLIAFNDRDMDAWFTGIINQEPVTARLHAFSDAIIFTGINPLTKPVQNFDNTKPMLRDVTGQTIVAIHGTKVNIQNQTKNLATILQSLVSTLQGLTVNVGTGVPNPPWLSQLTSIASDLGDLLE